MGAYHAGFDVIGVDNDYHPEYPFTFDLADATTYPLDEFDLLMGSPPCHDHSVLRYSTGRDHGTAWMLDHTIERFQATGLPWVVENVPGAQMDGLYTVTLCGSMFGLGATCRDGQYRQLRRHRKFASNRPLSAPRPCEHIGEPVGVYGKGGPGRRYRAGHLRPDTNRRAGYQGYRDEAMVAMGIDWMPFESLAQAIPPVYSQHLAAQLLSEMATR